jgi:hypothetical protein
VIFDARGAYKAELNEYNVMPGEIIKKEIQEIEREVILNSDFRLAVSNSLVNYWKKEYDYNSDQHIVVPCTLSADLIFDLPGEEDLRQNKIKMGFEANDNVIVYSGSSSGWQSFSLAEKILGSILEKDPRIKLLWLTNHLNENSDFIKKYKNRIKTAWVKPEEVKNYLLAGDHGLLYREHSITNAVASPVKFAEYLSCGLNVMISDGLGDFSEFVRKNNCGSVGPVDSLSKVIYATKLHNHQLAMQYLKKENYRTEYLKLLSA